MHGMISRRVRMPFEYECRVEDRATKGFDFSRKGHQDWS